MKTLLLFVLALSLHATAQAADNFSTLEERMSGKEFKETGLGKLTDAELAALNDWLRRHSVATLENAAARPTADATVTSASTSANAKKDMRGFENQPKGSKEDNVIHSNIVGTFDGWKAKGTLFKLANGMIWQQSENDRFDIEPIENPEIEIRRGIMGNWRLKTVEHNSAVRVKRIQ
jgi:hypothetical protein